MTTSAPAQFSDKWAYRFSFFDAYGAPNTETYKAAFKKLDFRSKAKVNANIWAFFFGPFYLCLIGLWKKALVLTAVMFTALFLAALLSLPEFLHGALGFASSLLFALTTNYAYYLKQVKGQDGWNAFEGLRL